MNKVFVSAVLVVGMLLASYVLEARSAGDLVMYLPFDDEKGQIAEDASGNGNNGTLSGGPQWVNGKLGGALNFVGSSYVELALDAGWFNDNINDLTIFMWVQSYAGATDKIFFGVQNPDNSRLYLAAKAGNWDMGIASTPWAGGHQGTLLAVDDDWHAITLTMSSGKATLYVDGEVTITKSYSTYVMDIASIIGALHGGVGANAPGYFFDGVIDEARIWRRL